MAICIVQLKPYRFAGKKRTFVKYIIIILFGVFAHAAEPALKCNGVKANNPVLQYELALTGVNHNAVTVFNSKTKEKCECKFRMSDFHDGSKAVVQQHEVSMVYQSCDKTCTAGLKQQISANIEITYKQQNGEANAVPFVGRQISKCDKFSIDLFALRRLEADRISRLDVSPEVKQRIKDIKGVNFKK